MGVWGPSGLRGCRTAVHGCRGQLQGQIPPAHGVPRPGDPQGCSRHAAPLVRQHMASLGSHAGDPSVAWARSWQQRQALREFCCRSTPAFGSANSVLGRVWSGVPFGGRANPIIVRSVVDMVLDPQSLLLGACIPAGLWIIARVLKSRPVHADRKRRAQPLKAGPPLPANELRRHGSDVSQRSPCHCPRSTLRAGGHDHSCACRWQSRAAPRDWGWRSPRASSSWATTWCGWIVLATPLAKTLNSCLMNSTLCYPSSPPSVFRPLCTAWISPSCSDSDSSAAQNHIAPAALRNFSTQHHILELPWKCA